ncbi:MAG: hypothetical protein KKC79_12415 [Gammaproteobacteria bacterium]|nr:hypothetical protein [Gammaproteobacteria bacterium]MBU1442940.1 hypothetical protein [Gammaproteobacteria bacterium]MBU2409435.1 hypothetical protein [Gammaproteobacteria bacterium]
MQFQRKGGGEFASDSATGAGPESGDFGSGTRYMWESRYGPILIEVIGDDIFVNGQRVERSIRQPEPPGH